MVKPGDVVKKGDPVAVMEAMKMEVGCRVYHLIGFDTH